MAQENNHIMQSFTDVLVVNADGPNHEYRGVSPIHVDNLTDKISIEPGAITKLESTESVHVNVSANPVGNTVYTLDVDPSISKTYEGIYPVNVDNSNNEISVNNVNFDVQFPLYGTVDDTTLTLGSKFGYHFSSGASGTVSNEVNYVAYIDETEDPYIRIRDDSQNSSQDFGFLLKTLPPTANSSYQYSFGGDHEWHQIPTVPASPAGAQYTFGSDKTYHKLSGYYITELPYIRNDPQIVDTSNTYQTFVLDTVSGVNSVMGNFMLIAQPDDSSSAVAINNAKIEIQANNELINTYYLQVLTGSGTAKTHYFFPCRYKLPSNQTGNITFSVVVYNGCWKNGTSMYVGAYAAGYNKYV